MLELWNNWYETLASMEALATVIVIVVVHPRELLPLSCSSSFRAKTLARLVDPQPTALLPERLERRAHLGREQLRLLPRREVAALLDLVEVDQFGVGPTDPGLRREIGVLPE